MKTTLVSYRPIQVIIALFIAVTMLMASTCKFGPYKFTDASEDPDLKTFKVTYIENKARYVNPQLSPRITDRLRQKIIAQTKMIPTTGEADLEISGEIREYSVTTSGVAAGSNASTNRLNVGLFIDLKNNKKPNKSQQVNIARNFDFSASLSIAQAEAGLTDDIVKNVVDEIFNKIFSNW